MGTKLKLTFKGFDLLLDQIKEADGSIESSTERALESSAQLVTQEIRAGAQKRNLKTDTLINPKPKWNGNRCSVEVGFELGAYDSKNLSTGYKALFKEYGTAKRSTSKGANRGKIAADPFIRPAVSSNKKQIHKAQEKALERILKELKG